MFGETIQKLRKSYGYTQVSLAEKLGVTKQAVSNWENNNILPSIDMLIKIADFSLLALIFYWSLTQDHSLKSTD